MDTQTWTIIFAAINAVIAVTAVVAALAAPRISTRLSAQTELTRTKRQEKLLIFAQLMSNRPAVESLDAVRALNLIEVIYHDHKEIRRVWKEFHGMISNQAFFEPGSGVGWELVKQKRSELLSLMARDLNYDIDTFDVDRVYAPRWLVEQERITLADRKLKLAAAEQVLSAQPPPSGSSGATEHQQQSPMQPVPPASDAGKTTHTKAGAPAAG